MTQTAPPPSPGPDIRVPPAVIAALLLLTAILAIAFIVAASVVQTP